MFHNSKNRFVEFSDGVFSVILTILVLEIRLPTNGYIFSKDCKQFLYSILIYIAGFSLISTYWFFHQELFSSIKKINSADIVLNFYFLFFISLMPILTRLIAQNPFNKFNEFIYAMVFLIFNSYLLWIFHRVFLKLSRQQEWSKLDIKVARKELIAVRGTVFVGIIACCAAWFFGPLTPIILAVNPLFRKAGKLIYLFAKKSR